MISKLQKIKTEDEDDYDQYDRDYFCSTNCRYMNDLGVFLKYFLILAFLKVFWPFFKLKTEDEDDYHGYDRDYFCSTYCRYMNDLGVFFKIFALFNG